jgi:hypothetical protein
MKHHDDQLRMRLEIAQLIADPRERLGQPVLKLLEVRWIGSEDGWQKVLV